jgi:hypothetical protein
MPIAEPILPGHLDLGVDCDGDSFEQVVSRSEAEGQLERASREQLATVVRDYFPKIEDRPSRHSWSTHERSVPILVSLHWGLADDTYREFTEQLSLWESQTKFLSSTTALITNPAYLRIIAMGERVLPYLLAELRDHPNYWFWALEAITGRDPASTNDNFDTRVAKWLHWGESAGLVRASD